MKIFLVLMSLHFLADFLFQSDWMAVNKSKRWLPLLAHVSSYSICFLMFGWKFAAITFLCHLLTDAITSRITSRLWQINERHWFFVTIGFDQLLHTFQLALTWQFLFGR